mgnify:CR=1 FL=1
MKNFIKSIRITIAFCILFSVCYVLILWVFGQFFGPGKGNAETITLNGKVVGAANVGQAFTKDIYFWGRLRLPIIRQIRQLAPIKDLPTKHIWQKWRHG